MSYLIKIVFVNLSYLIIFASTKTTKNTTNIENIEEKAKGNLKTLKKHHMPQKIIRYTILTHDCDTHITLCTEGGSESFESWQQLLARCDELGICPYADDVQVL